MKTFDLNQKKREDLIRDIKNILLEDQNINFAYIFGSFVENNIFRDIDIGIYLGKIDEKKFLIMNLKYLII